MAEKKKTAKKAPRKSAHGSKSAFVKTLPANLSAKEVVAQANASGISLTEAYVYNIRSMEKRGASKGLTKAPKAKPRAGKMSKTDFVRALPADVTYVEAEAKARAAGIVLSKAYFYVLKSTLKRAGTKGPGMPSAKPGPKPRGSHGAAGIHLASENADEQALLNAVRRIGADRARSLILAVERLRLS